MGDCLMTSVIAISNIAGGTQKTTASHSLAVAMVEYGKKVLLIDLDPRAELTFNLGLERLRVGIVEMLQGSSLTQSNDITTEERFDFIGSDSRLSTINDIALLQAFLSTLENRFDVVVLDTPSAIDTRLAMAFNAADAIVIPASHSNHSMRGAVATSLIESRAEKYILAIDQFKDSLAEHIQHTKIIDAVIPMTDGLDIAIALKRSFLTTDKSSEFAQAYREATYSILEELNLI